jgi:hypothetical protein
MHFQAGNADFLPLVGDYFNLKAQGKCTMQCTIDGADIYTIDDYLRVVYCIESCDRDALRQAFMKLYNSWVKEEGIEPMMNVVCLYKESTVNGQQSTEGKWYLFVIPRGAFRPWQYTAEGDKQLLVSPATVEVSGLFITPVKEHFERITKEDVVDILTQCTIK